MRIPSVFENKTLTLADVESVFPLYSDDEHVGPYIVDHHRPQTCPFCPQGKHEETSCLRLKPTTDQLIVLSRVLFPRSATCDAAVATYDSASRILTLPDQRQFQIPRTLFSENREVTSEAESIYRQIIPGPTKWCHDPSLHRLELKHVDLHCYSSHELPELKDGNFFTQKFNEFLMLDLEYDQEYDDMYSQAYIRCLMFCNIFHPTLSEAQKMSLTDLYYCTTEVSKIEPE